MSEEVKDQVENTEEQREYTPQELKAMQDNMIKYYKDQIRLLKPQEEFERLQADIAEHKARRLYNMIKHAQMQMGPADEEYEEEEPAEEPVKEPRPKRTLKTD